MAIVEIIEILRTLHIRVIAWLSLGGTAALAVMLLGWGGVFPGYERADAHAADIARLTKQVGDQISSVNSGLVFLKQESMEEAIRSKLTTACMTQDHAFQVELQREVNDLEKRYYALTGQGYRQPACAEL
jgi:hypothetical protein